MFGSKPASASPTFLPQANGPVLVAGSAPGYALAADLSQRFALLQLTGSRALESQQQDEAAKQAAVDEVKQTIAEYDKEHPATGPLHVYLMDGKVAAATDEEGASMLKALVSAAMSQPSRTVAALLPEDATCTSVDQLSPATMLASLANTVLAVEGLTILVGKPALEAFLTEGEVSGFNQATDGTVNPTLEDAGVTVSLAAFGIMGLVGYVAGRINRRRAEKGQLSGNADDALKQLDVRLKSQYANASWLAKQSFRNTPVPGKVIGKQLNLTRAISDPAHQGQLALHSARQWVQVYTPSLRSYLSTISRMAQAQGETPMTTAQVLAMGKTLQALRDPLATAPLHGTGFLQGSAFKPSSIGTELTHVDGTPPAELPSLTAAEVKACAVVIGLLLQEADELSIVAEEMDELTWDISEPDTGDEDDERDYASAEGKAQALIWETFHAKDIRRNYCWPYRVLQSALEQQAVGMARWIEASIEGAVATEAFEESIPDSDQAFALEGFGDAVKAFRRVFSSKVPHPDGLPKSPNLDVSQPAQRQFAKTYLNPSWLSIQKLVTGTVSGNGIVVDLQVNGALPQDPLAAVSSGGVAIKTYVTSHAAAMQKYLLAAEQLINAHANATDEATKASTAQQLEALVSPFKIGDAQALSKVPGAPSVVETDDDAAVRPSTAKMAAEQIPALTAEQIPQYAKAVLAVMKETYELSSLVGSQLKVFNQLVDLSHNKALVAKLSPAVASKLQNLAKGKGVWVLFDYCSMLLVQATALERWCYRSVGGKAA